MKAKKDQELMASLTPDHLIYEEQQQIQHYPTAQQLPAINYMKNSHTFPKPVDNLASVNHLNGLVDNSNVDQLLYAV